MDFRPSRKFAVQPQLAWGIFPLLLAFVYLFGASSPLYAQEVITFRIPHEVQRAAMLVIDLDGDGKKEIIAASKDGYVTVVDGGNYGILWDKNMADYLDGYDKTRIQSGLAAADLDGDDRLEIVVATGGADPIDGDGPGALIVLTYVGGAEFFSLMPGLPVYAFDELGPSGGRGDGHPDGFTSTPVLGDIDGDGDKEIVIGGMDRRLHAFHHDGSYVTGWPLDRSRDVWRESRSTAALADLDGDGILDILIGSNNYTIPNCANPYLFYGLKGNSAHLPGFPIQTTQNIESAPVLADLDRDGFLDIVFGTGEFNQSCTKPGGQQTDGKKVYAINRLGQPLPGWPVRTNGDTVNSPALGDLDSDGVPEVIIHTGDTLYAWHADGSLVQGFPVYSDSANGDYYIPRHAAPVLADVDGDSQVEILLASGHVYGPNGQLEVKRNKLFSQLVVTDQDGDGLFETIGANHYNPNFGWHLQVYIFQESGPATGAQPWPMFQRSIDRNGLLPTGFVLRGRIVDKANHGVPDVQVTLNSGQIAITDQEGNYVFGDLPAGDYTVTPSYGNNPFEPAQRHVTLSTNTLLQTMVMRPEVFDIQGKVLHANGSPMAGIVVQLNTGATVTTGADGLFVFHSQQPGTYTISPVSPGLTYQPSQRSVKTLDERPQTFFALKPQVVKSLIPDGPTEITFEDTQGLPTYVTFPEGFGNDSAIITPLMTPDPSGYHFAGHGFELALAGAEATIQSEVVGQDGEPLSIEVTVQYNTADLQLLLDEEELVMLWLSPDGWVDAQSTCPSGSGVDHDMSDKTYTVPVCQWGTYGLFAPIDRLYMPRLSTAGE